MGTITFRNHPLPRILTALGAAALASALAGCGGGGSSGAAPTELAFSVNWEQPATGAAASSSATSGSGHENDAVFDTPIPPSVNAIRFVFHPAAPGTACCIAVPRGSQPFIDRHIQLANITEGAGGLEVNGYPTEGVPAAPGVTAICPTRPLGQGVACGGEGPNTLPSFGSDEVPVDVQPNQVNVVNVDVHSLPFLIDLSPADGETADSARPDVDFTVVDAVHTIDGNVNIRIKDQAVTDHPDILTSEECLDGDSALPDCSPSGSLQVHGLRITSRATQNLPEGTADLRIQASNTAATPQSMESNTTFVVPGGETTTTTSTTSTTGNTSTTTTLQPATFCLKFSVSNAVDLVGISYDVSYGSTGGQFTGSGENVSCVGLLSDILGPVLTSFNDVDATSTLSTAIVSGATFSGPVALAQCEFRQVPPLGSFQINVTEATAPDLSPASATVIVEETQCAL